MKKGLLTTVFLAICLSMLMAQIPQAFKYQAVVRDHNGTIIADQNINLRISILFGDPSGETVYSETHPCNTNGMGLVNLEIGRGFNPTGNISAINWAQGQYFVKIEMDEYGGSDFKPMGVAQLLSVPYALHSGTAEGISGDEGDGVPANNWILFGNSNTDPTEDKLGTTDAADLVIVTDNVERMRVLSGGDVEIVNSLNIGKNLTVEENVFLNTNTGATINNGPFTVANLSPTLLSGILTVDLHTDLNSSLNVDGVTDLNSAFNVNNTSPSLLTGTLLVNENATFNQHVTLDNPSLNSTSISTGGLVVAGGVGIGRDLWVGGTANFDGPLAVHCDFQSHDIYTGALTVAGGVGIVKRVNIGGATMIDSTLAVNGQLTITANPGSQNQDNYADYPLQVQGSNQGIAIKVNGSRANSNNYVSFWDESSGKMWGRIEGITIDELHSDPEYMWEHGFKITNIVVEGVDFAMALFEIAQGIVDVGASLSSSTACVGFGACVTAPIPAFIVSSGVNLVLKIANAVSSGANLGLAIAEEVTFNVFLEDNIGVSYQSGAGDYAEWLPKANPGEMFNPGDLVGVTNGYVTKSTSGADKVMVVSTRPIVLGNMPPEQDEINYEKIAFMGQVPVRIVGDVMPGDYILPSLIGSGFGRAVHPEDMQTRDYKKIAGVAWSVIAEIADGVNLVNVAVGINANDLSDLIYKLEEQFKVLQSESDQLKAQMEQSNAVLADLVPGFADAIGINYSADPPEDAQVWENDGHAYAEYNVVQSDEEDILYFEISRVQIEYSIEIARETYQQMIDDAAQAKTLFTDLNNESYSGSENTTLIPIKDHPFWQRIDSDPEYKEEVIQYIQTNLEKAMNTHKKHAHKFTDLKLHE